MNNPHHGARLTVHSREQIVARISAGQGAGDVARAFGVSLRTVRKWLARFRAGGRVALSNHSSAPARVAGRLCEATVALILHLRRTLRMTGAAIAAKPGLARSTVSRWLRRDRLGRLAQVDPREPVHRYQRERPGELIHLDIKKPGRFDQPGHRLTGTRVGCRNRGAGWDFVHVAVDDATRLAYVEVLGDARRNTTTGFLLRALRWFSAQGIKAERVMTDRAIVAPSVQARWRGAAPTAHAASPGPCDGWPSATSSPGPTHPRPTARQRGSSRPSGANGPMVWNIRPPPRATPTCRAGSTGSTGQDHTLHSTACHPSQG